MTTRENETVKAAMRWVGTPYRHQASQLGVGCDCLGLVRGVWRTLHGQEPGNVPPYSQTGRDPNGARQLLDAAQYFLQLQPEKMRPGNVVLFQLHKSLPPRHCGILLARNQLVHAQERLGVIALDLDARWQRRIHSTYSFPTEV